MESYTLHISYVSLYKPNILYMSHIDHTYSMHAYHAYSMTLYVSHISHIYYVCHINHKYFISHLYWPAGRNKWFIPNYRVTSARHVSSSRRLVTLAGVLVG